MRVLGLDPVVFWRALHALGSRISLGEAIDGWTQDTVGDLVTVLEEVAHPDAESALAGAGLFVPHETGVDLTEELLSAARRFCAAHVIDADELEAMIRYRRSVRAAVELYFEEHTSIDALVESCAESFRIRGGLPDVAAVTAERYLRRLFTRHVLSRQGLLALLEHRLRLAAAERGFADPEERARTRRSARPTRAMTGRRAWALEVMGLEEEMLAADTLRERYRQMMMRHHPDVDPSGLERCKDVNVAYSYLIAELVGGE